MRSSTAVPFSQVSQIYRKISRHSLISDLPCFVSLSAGYSSSLSGFITNRRYPRELLSNTNPRVSQHLC